MTDEGSFEDFWEELADVPQLRKAVEAIRARPSVRRIAESFWRERPELRGTAGPLLRAFSIVSEAFSEGRKLFICGNGGSFADALHISGELMKSYLILRKLPEVHFRAVERYGGRELASALQPGFPVIVLGLNHSLLSALENDVQTPRIGFAQELYCLGRNGDVLLGISTSGKAVNVLHATAVAKALGMATIALTGQSGGPLAQRVDLAIRVPASQTRAVQEMHQALYHALCAMLEAHFFGPPD